MKRAIVDVDNTLWNFHVPLHKRLQELYGIPDLIGKVTKWNFYYELGLTDKQFYIAVSDVHFNQRFYEPLDGARELLKALDALRFEVFIASCRTPQTADSLAEWMLRYGLRPYSLLYTGDDKVQFFRKGDLLIDDAPHTIEKGHEMGLDVVYLDWPWNRPSIGDGLPDLYAVIRHIEEKCNANGVYG